MLPTILRSAYSYFKGNKTFTLINLAGMALGFSACFFALLYLRSEFSYDHFNKNADRIFRVVTDVKTDAGIDYQTPGAPVGPALAAAFPEIEISTRYFLDYLMVQKNKEVFAQENIAYADSSLFQVFTIPLVIGNRATALQTPHTIVLSESAAARYFGRENAVGKQLILDGKHQATVTGIMKDMPFNSHFRTDILVSMSTLLKAWNPSLADSWSFNGFNTYVLLKNGTTTKSLAAKLPAFVDNNFRQDKAKYTLGLEPLKSVYLHALARGSRTGTIVTGNYSELVMTGIVALFVLLIACFNFVNLTTAFSLKRAKEIGVRKVLGASRKQLIIQFLVDAVILSALAFVVSILLSLLFLDGFNMIAGKTVVKNVISQWPTMLLLGLIAIISGTLAGIYPALFLSGFRPALTVRGRFSTGTQGIWMRKALVVSQFVISITLIIATLVVFYQLQFMRGQRESTSKDQILAVDYFFDQRLNDARDQIRNKMLNIPGVKAVSFSGTVPGKENRKRNTEIENRNGIMQSAMVDFYGVDPYYMQQYGLELVAGRSFADQLAIDSTEGLIINESAVRSLGFVNAGEAIGKKFSQMNRHGRIIGVFKDFHFHSFREEIRPLTLRPAPGVYTFVSITVNPRATQQAIGTLNNLWQEIAPGMPSEYGFVDESFRRLFISEERTARLFTGLAILAVLISCLGLFGLASFSTKQRQKETGIRKVLGASVTSLVRLLSVDLLKQVALALVIAAPLGWWAMHQWLQQFAYRIEMNVIILAIAGIVALAIAFFTISILTIRAANANPVNSISNE